MNFLSSSSRFEIERINREAMYGKQLKFGVSFLDQATRGFFPNDLVLIGAPTGVGKTDLCVQIAHASLEAGRKVHYFALEAEENEIEQRLLYPMIAQMFYADPERPRLDRPLNLADWLVGFFHGQISSYEMAAESYCRTAYRNLHTFYKGEKFGIDELTYHLGAIADETDLVIVDHLHYFDWEDTDDNRAIKEIAKKVRHLALDLGKPVILIAQLRKADKKRFELAPNEHEFMGSSDLAKTATKIITFSDGDLGEDGKLIRYFRICKNRKDNSICKYTARLKFDYKTRRYDEKFRLAKHYEPFKELEIENYPFWVGEFREHVATRGGSDFNNLPARQPAINVRRAIPNLAPGGR